jgi:hypothetical protein
MVAPEVESRIFTSNPNIVGQTVSIKGGPAKVLAVMPAGFRGTDRIIDPQVYVAFASWYTWNPNERSSSAASRANRAYKLFGRLRENATLDQARQQLQILNSSLAAQFPQANSGRQFVERALGKAHLAQSARPSRRFGRIDRN